MTTPDRPLSPSSITLFKRLIVQLMRLHWKPTSSRPTRSNRARALHHAIALMMLLSPPLHAAQLLLAKQKYNQTSASNPSTQITFSSAFDNPPILILLPTTNGAHPAGLQIASRSNTSAAVLPIEPNNLDGLHASMTSTSLAIEPGSYKLSANGPRVEARTVDVMSTVSAIDNSSWTTVTFPQSFDSPPAVVVTIQSRNNEQGTPPTTPSRPWITPVVRNITTHNFQVALDRSEAYNDGGSITTAETIGYVAMERGSGTFKDKDDNDIKWASFDTHTTGGYDQLNTATLQSFATILGSNPFTSTPLLVASKTSRATSDGGWLRQRTINQNSFRLVIDEDSNYSGGYPLLTGQDTERTHTATDNISVIAFSQSFEIAELINNAPPQFSLKKTVSVVSDPINLTTNPKAIPDSILEYALTLTNESFGPLSNDPDTLVLKDEIPNGTELVVAPSFSSGTPCGSATTYLVQGTPSSGLSCVSGTVTYSDDGSTYSNTASTSTKHIRIAPTGTFSLATDAANLPNVTFKFQVKKN